MINVSVELLCTCSPNFIVNSATTLILLAKLMLDDIVTKVMAVSWSNMMLMKSLNECSCEQILQELKSEWLL